MSNNQLKHEKAWDNVRKCWVRPEDVLKGEAHDRNRYFTEQFGINEDKGKVLTLHKASKKYKSKNGVEVERKAHFAVIADNTREYREQTAKKIVRQESLVHKLCKNVIKELEFMKVPSVQAQILGENITIIHEQYVKIHGIVGTEQKDTESGRIPDATIQVELLGKKQDIFLEFLYKHEVSEAKRKEYTYYKKNCLEIDISELQDNLDDSEKILKKKIRKAISEQAYWISNRFKQLIETDAVNKFVVEMSKKNGILLDTIYEDKGGFYKRLYFFKDNLSKYNIPSEHPCYFKENPGSVYTGNQKCVNIGQCNECSNCIWIKGYYSDNTDDTVIYCRKDGKCEKIHPVKLVDTIIEYAKSLLDTE